jgi:hypothetical protein
MSFKYVFPDNRTVYFLLFPYNIVVYIWRAEILAGAKWFNPILIWVKVCLTCIFFGGLTPLLLPLAILLEVNNFSGFDEAVETVLLCLLFTFYPYQLFFNGYKDGPYIDSDGLEYPLPD